MTTPLKSQFLESAVPDKPITTAAANTVESIERSSLEDFAVNAWGSFRYSLIQAPAKALAQISDHAVGTRLADKAEFWEKPKHEKFGSAAWFGQAVGGTVGGALPFLLFHKLAGPGAATKMERLSTYSVFSKGAIAPIAKSVGVGAGYHTLFTPVEEGEDFLTAKVREAAVGGATWGVLTGTSIGIKGLGLRTFNRAIREEAAREAGISAAQTTVGRNILSRVGENLLQKADPILAKRSVRAFLQNDVAEGVIAGTVAGSMNAQLHSLSRTGRLASISETAETAATFSFGGALLGGVNIVHERYFPSSGIKGVRTLEDMTKLADSTMSPNRPARYQFEQQGADKNLGIVKSYRDGEHFRLTKMIEKELEPSTLEPEIKARVSRGVHDLVTGFEAISGQGPIVTVYGSARPKVDHFAYQRARYLGGRLAQEGYAVMGGGGPGIMEASNRGAYQAGGRSIGVSLELPWEQSSNGYQTTVLTHANYFTRKEILRAHDAAVIEMGGYGTLDEFAEVLTHIQTQKKVGTPIYLIESKATKRFDKYVRELESEGTISKGDRDLYIMVKGPDDVIHDLARRRLQTREPSVDQTVPAFDAAGITFRQSNPSIGIFKPKS